MSYKSVRENIIVWGVAILGCIAFWAVVSVIYIGLHALAYR